MELVFFRRRWVPRKQTWLVRRSGPSGSGTLKRNVFLAWASCFRISQTKPYISMKLTDKHDWSRVPPLVVGQLLRDSPNEWAIYVIVNVRWRFMVEFPGLNVGDTARNLFWEVRPFESPTARRSPNLSEPTPNIEPWCWDVRVTDRHVISHVTRQWSIMSYSYSSCALM